MRASTIRATIGRVVHVYCPKEWQGARPGIVVGVQHTGEMPGGGLNQLVRVNVSLDGLTDSAVLEHFRGRQQGNTIECPLYDPLDDEDRDSLEQIGSVGNIGPTWAEWMPFQKGQAVKTEAAEGQLANRIDTLEEALGIVVNSLPWKGNLFAGDAQPHGLRAHPAINGAPLGVVLGVEAIAQACHEQWLGSADRSYSQINKPWRELTYRQRRDASRQVRQVLDLVCQNEAIFVGPVTIMDAYENPEEPAAERPYPTGVTDPAPETAPAFSVGDIVHYATADFSCSAEVALASNARGLTQIRLPNGDLLTVPSSDLSLIAPESTPSNTAVQIDRALDAIDKPE